MSKGTQRPVMRPAIIAIVLTVALIAGRIEAGPIKDAPFYFHCGKTFITFVSTEIWQNGQPIRTALDLVTQRKAAVDSVAFSGPENFIVFFYDQDGRRSVSVSGSYKEFVECLD
ncbi:MAG: hypothetical protein OXE57_01130 [Alphaproteobacteria bacterium]|nr:hypothetical protein [Alphaproteobacteria bacterium]